MSEDSEAKNLELHVAVCAERYHSLEMRLERIERIVWWSTTILISGMAGLIVKALPL